MVGSGPKNRKIDQTDQTKSSWVDLNQTIDLIRLFLIIKSLVRLVAI